METSRLVQQQSQAVTDFLAALDHPCKPEIEALRKIILGAHADIGEGIKWNAPSFRTSEFFATINLRAKGGLELIFHTGAKVKASATGGVTDGLQIDDPTGLLHWLAKDRASAMFTGLKDIDTKRTALKRLVREWIQHL
ncbi:DUF1801 domain-containing protein [Aquabacterium sp.]|uniref:DUF1801 domain-containing protein n=1 Tax=Aquabacterium sp. TaxID=1872578 RepID=UPI002BE77D70|nr:DUF1801 domain-containing protein [Aquabacterium sp.]HSW06336.1 DUF1801 domain-containing protein [Aquabacterium sp.]